MEIKEKKYIGAIIGLVIAIVAAIIGLVIMNKQIEKYDAIFYVACDYSSSPTTCKEGIEWVKGLSTEQIKSYSLRNYR